jgi:hypothetical protein
VIECPLIEAFTMLAAAWELTMAHDSRDWPDVDPTPQYFDEAPDPADERSQDDADRVEADAEPDAEQPEADTAEHPTKED